MAGMSDFLISTTAAICIEVGKLWVKYGTMTMRKARYRIKSIDVHTYRWRTGSY